VFKEPRSPQELKEFKVLKVDKEPKEFRVQQDLQLQLMQQIPPMMLHISQFLLLLLVLIKLQE
jgi:hypothetical protein